MEITLEKQACIAELEKALERFYQAKTIQDREQIKYFQGYCHGMIQIMKKLKIVDEDELTQIVKRAELDAPAIFRTPIKRFKNSSREER
ncbi:MAG: hypothetical protein IE918_06720 [Campylobacterales bacterium]|nr:hypothetical protein [Campylobacterales bacterium]